MKRPVCLVTGATDGVGRVTAMELAKKGFHVVIAARNAVKADALRREIRDVTGDDCADCVIGDLASLAQVRRLAASFGERHESLDVLVNNAGVFLPQRTVTEDGYETTFQVNYLSHFLLTHLLLDRLEKSDQGRVINLSSSVYTVGRFDPENLQSTKRFSSLASYSASKLFMLMFGVELAARLRGTRVTANVVHPGIVRTQMMLNAPGAMRVASYLALPFAASPESGARTTVLVASAPELASVSGEYFADSKRRPVKHRSLAERDRRLLWETSMMLAGEGVASGGRETG